MTGKEGKIQMKIRRKIGGITMSQEVTTASIQICCAKQMVVKPWDSGILRLMVGSGLEQGVTVVHKESLLRKGLAELPDSQNVSVCEKLEEGGGLSRMGKSVGFPSSSSGANLENWNLVLSWFCG